MRRGVLDEGEVQRAQQAAWESALRSSGLPVAGLDAEGGRPRFALAAPLAPTTPGEAELADVWLTERRPRWAVREALVPRMPPACTLVDLFDVWLGEAALPGQVVASVYRAAVALDTASVAAVDAAAVELVTADSVPRERARGERLVAYDLRPFIEAIDVRATDLGSAEIVMVLRHDPEKGVGRPDEVLAELATRSGVPLDTRVARTRLILASDAGGGSARPDKPVPPRRYPATAAATRRPRK